MELETVLPVIAGLLGPWIINFLKGLVGADDKSALWLSAITSVGLGVASMAIVGDLVLEFASVEAILEQAAEIFALATLVYKQWLAE